MANRNRNAGNGYERTVVQELKKLDYPDVTTARAESRNMDNKGIDVFGDSLPFYIQCKVSKDRPNYHKLILDTKGMDDRKPLFVFHKLVEKATTRFVTKGEYVILEKEEFYKLINLLNNK